MEGESAFRPKSASIYSCSHGPLWNSNTRISSGILRRADCAHCPSGSPDSARRDKLFRILSLRLCKRRTSGRPRTACLRRSGSCGCPSPPVQKLFLQLSHSGVPGRFPLGVWLRGLREDLLSGCRRSCRFFLLNEPKRKNT